MNTPSVFGSFAVRLRVITGGLLFVCFSLAFESSLFAQSYASLVRQADSLYSAKNYPLSLKTYKQAFKIDQKKAADLYNAACSAALAGEQKDAFAYLSLAIKHGWTNINHLSNDSDLAALHDHAQWKPLLQRLQAKSDSIEANYDKPLQAQLLQIFEDDQSMRNQYVDALKKFGQQHPRVDSIGRIIMYKDSINLIQVKAILDEKGWVGADKVGLQASQALFLVIQHADIKTQEKYLPMMRDAVQKGNARGSELALLEDRVALRRGRKQIYGSQLYTNSDTKQLYVAAMVDPDHVDERRASVGLGTMAEYVRNWNLVWDLAEYKKALPLYERLLKEAVEKKNSE